MKKYILILILFLSSCSKQVNFEKEFKRQDSIYDIKYNEIADADLIKTIKIIETEHSLNNKTLKRFMYTDEANTIYPAGMPLIIKEGNQFNLHIKNETSVDTNIHWHGLSLANDQDGPHLLIDNNGGTYDYLFTPDYSGTYWYHWHNRPVRDQVDFGMHGPLIILSEEDKQYTLDRIMMLDDWIVNRNTGHMQVEGDLDTVNGLSGDDIEAIVIDNTDLVKLRLIQASTAKDTIISFPFAVKVTHLDGIALEKPYTTNKIKLSPAERYDIEFKIDQEDDEIFYITNERDKGMIIPVVYTNTNKQATYTQIDYKVQRTDNLVSKIGDTPDIDVIMNNTMSHGKGHQWTINGEVFPYAEEFELELGKEYLIRFHNASRMFNHPMHIHGSHFKVISINGIEPSSTIWKDTIDVLPREYVDVAVKFERPGLWMLHCHILDHEDGGMMTTIIVE